MPERHNNVFQNKIIHIREKIKERRKKRKTRQIKIIEKVDKMLWFSSIIHKKKQKNAIL